MANLRLLAYEERIASHGVNESFLLLSVVAQELTLVVLMCLCVAVPIKTAAMPCPARAHCCSPLEKCSSRIS